MQTQSSVEMLPSTIRWGRLAAGWLLAAVFACAALPQDASAQAVTVYQYFEGLPAGYTGEPGESWQGVLYYAKTFDTPTEPVTTVRERSIGGDQFLCTGWKNGLGDIPETGDTCAVDKDLSNPSSLTWIYTPSHSLQVAIAGFEQQLWDWGGSNDVAAPMVGSSPFKNSTTIDHPTNWGAGARYYSTIQTADFDGDGQLEMWGRGVNGVLVWKLNANANRWDPLVDVTTAAPGPHRDDWGWWAAVHYATLQAADIDGDGRDELLGRGIYGMVVWRYANGGFTQVTSPTAAAEAPFGSTWDHSPSYYTTIQTADLDGDGRAELFGRGAAGIQVWRFNGSGWVLIVNGSDHRDDYGWSGAQHYTTLQAADIDGDGRDEILGRAIDGVHVWRLSGNALAEMPITSLAFGATWGTAPYYGTIQTADLDGDGDAELIGRGAGGLQAWNYDSVGRRWVALATTGPFPDATGWAGVSYYSTIQAADIDGDGRDEVLGRGVYGLEAWRWDTATGAWAQVVRVSATAPTEFRDSWGWGAEQHYATIQAVDVNADGRAEVVGRHSGGLELHHFSPTSGTWVGGARVLTAADMAARIGSAGRWAVLSSGDAHRAAITIDGTLWTWGDNAAGQLGSGNTTARTTPAQVGSAGWTAVSAGGRHTLAIEEDGTLWAWGDNTSGQVDPAAPANYTSPHGLAGASTWSAVAAGSRHSVAVRSDGTLWAWGANGQGQLGLGDTNAYSALQQVGTDTDWASAAAGPDYTLALKADGSLWTWGDNTAGRVGAGGLAVARYDAPVPIAVGSTWTVVAAGRSHAVAVRSDGTLWVWGSNRWGQLGRGYTGTAVATPTQVGTAGIWRAVAAGFDYTLAIRKDGSLWGWGSNEFGQLGNLRDTAGNTLFYTPSPIRIESAAGAVWVMVAAGDREATSLRSPDGVRFEALPHLGTRPVPEGESVRTSVQVRPLDGTPPYLLGAWQGGFGDVAATGGSMGVTFDLTRDTGLSWTYAPLVGTVVGLNVDVATDLPASGRDDPGFQPVVGDWSFAEGATVELMAPADVTITIPPDPDAPTEILGIPVVPEPTYEAYRCTGWIGTGSVPATGTGCTVSVALAAPSSSITWQYALDEGDLATVEVNLPSDLPTLPSGESPWTDAAADLATQGVEAGTWQTAVPLTSADHRIENLDSGSTAKITTAYEIDTVGGVYKCTGLAVTATYMGSAMTVTKNRSGDRMEFVVSIPPPPPENLNLPPQDKIPLDLAFTLVYKQAAPSPIAAPIPLTLAVDESWQDRITTFVAGHPADQKADAFYYDADAGLLYPVKPVPFFEIDGVAYYADWPSATVTGVIAGAPVNLQPDGSSYTFEAVTYSESYTYGTWVLADAVFQPPAAGRSLLRFSDAAGAPLFVTVDAVDLAAPAPTAAIPWAIGTPLTDPTHSDPDGKNGYVYNAAAPIDGALTEVERGDHAYARDTRDGPLIPVNTDDPATAADDLLVVWYSRGAIGPAAAIGWPRTVRQYAPFWPVPDGTLVVASGNGSGLLPEHKAQGRVYVQPDSGLPGYNPNEEHALLLGGTLYALRDDLNTYVDTTDTWVGPLASDQQRTSEPFVLLKYRDLTSNAWTLDVYLVVAEETVADLDGDGVLSTLTFVTPVGSPILPLAPISLLPLAAESTVAGGDQWYHRDHKGGHWAKAACSAGSADCPSEITMHWYYPLQGGFYYPDDTKQPGDAVPLLAFAAGGAGSAAIDAVYATSWPGDAPTLPIGETLTNAKYGLPEVAAMAAADVIFDENINNGGGPLASTYAPFVARTVSLEQAPTGARTETRGDKVFFTDLPESLQSRLFYDPLVEELSFRGLSIDYGIGEPLLLPNILTERERDRLLVLEGADARWATAVGLLFDETRAPADPAPAGASLALTAGMADGEGYVVLAENDDPSLGTAPVALHVIHVTGGPYRGDIKVIASDNPFDEKLTLRHSGDFGGQPERLYFKWYYQPDVNGVPPRFPTGDPATAGWVPFGEEGYGVNDITIEGAGLLTLSDNWFMVRYYYGDDPSTPAADAGYPALTVFHPDSGPGNPDYNWSPWAGAPGGETAQLAEGWIKRVVNNLNPLDARVKDFRNNETSTQVSMIAQLGERHEGAIALDGSPENLNNIGLIEAYATVLDRGEQFSIGAAPPTDYGPANVALLNAASRIGGFYTLLGNEAYADAQDPTLGFDTRSVGTDYRNGEMGIMASSLFAFRNQLDSLLEEELALLRGRDDSLATTRARPVYNRLIWNFTNGEGEVAYVQAYNVPDRDASGVIDELDAKEMYPQGHGDAWGHYLTAMTTWYGLLRHPSYTWQPRIESVLVGGTPVPVDYLDERKFAETAAAKARTGAEIVDLTYRREYVADPAGRWQGYKDTDPERAWGVDDWARRAGQGAYFDWVVANAMLPSEDPNPEHTGIQKIDRGTVPGLGEIAAQYHAIQWQLDEADAGLNPLGLADGVVSFDLDTADLEPGAGLGGQTHFGQIYDRAVAALGNAANAFDFANRYTLRLRGNQDDLLDFRRSIVEQERAYTNRLIELFGYPYVGDIGGGGAYPEGYEGPDLFHFMYMDAPELTGLDDRGGEPVVYTATFDWTNGAYLLPYFGLAELTTSQEPLTVEFPTLPNAPWRFEVPDTWGGRRAPGEVQLALSELISGTAAYRQGLVELAGILDQIRATSDILLARYSIGGDQIHLVDASNTTYLAATGIAGILYNLQGILEIAGDFTYDLGDAMAEGIPVVAVNGKAKAGFITTLGGIVGADVSATTPVKAVTKVYGSLGKLGLRLGGQAAGAVGDIASFGAEAVQLNRDQKLFTDDLRFEVKQRVEELDTMRYDAESKILELFTLAQAMDQAFGTYRAALAEGDRLLAERETFRKYVAGDVQDARYQDFAFRTFRNDAVQKYRATFDLAARYAYLAASAYDYETNLLGTDAAPGRRFLADIVKRRSPGELADGVPVAGDSGLSDPLARLEQNFGVYRTQLGLNNPQTEDNRFSLRRELFRLRADASGDTAWKAQLRSDRKANLWQNPSFRRYCRPFVADSDMAQPGLVIPFSTEITFGHNLFGWPLGPGDSALDPTNFTTKLFGVSVHFEGYENAGLSNTPRVYLVPVGADVLRSPTDDNFVTRNWHVVDQKLPVPFPISEAEFNDPTLIPVNDLLSDQFGGIRRHSSFRAHFDGGDAFNASEENLDLRLVGRSAWNTQWILIIPGGTLLDDPDAGLDAFVRNVTDIQLTLSTYAFSGN